MSKSPKELAFLRDLTVTEDWTTRFTSFADKHFKLPKEGNFLYFNAGTLSHALKLRDELDKDVELTATFESPELRKISEAKATVIKAKIRFNELDELKSESFDTILADLSFVSPTEVAATLDDILFVTEPGGRASILLPTAGSFGEIFSYLWETFLDIDLVEKGVEIERLISEIATVSQAEELAANAGLKGISSEISTEVFEYDSGKDFISSTLVSDFLAPRWLDFLTEKEQKKTLQKLSEIIDAEQDGLTFRFTVKATLLQGVKD